MITGDMSIEQRPMKRIMTPLSQMGAEVVSVMGNDCAPLRFTGGKQLRGINYRSPVASAQVKSCIMLAGLYAEGDTVVYEPALSRNHTEIMLSSFGADIHNELARDGSAAAILHPGDISSAAYFIAAALIVPGSELLIRNVGINKTRAGILNVLNRWAQISLFLM